jgi:hypothetical protein
MVYNVKDNSLRPYCPKAERPHAKIIGPGCNLPPGVAYREVVGTMKLATNIDQQDTRVITEQENTQGR